MFESRIAQIRGLTLCSILFLLLFGRWDSHRLFLFVEQKQLCSTLKGILPRKARAARQRGKRLTYRPNKRIDTLLNPFFMLFGRWDSHRLFLFKNYKTIQASVNYSEACFSYKFLPDYTTKNPFLSFL